jgi:hypothetical protein
MDKKYYVYTHSRNDTNEYFYVGKGTSKRAWSRYDRNNLWHKIAKKHGYTVRIEGYFDKEQDAFWYEKYLIGVFKSRGYNLANFTDGGDGISGYKHTEATKQKLSETRKELYLNEEYANKMAKIRKEQWTEEARQNAAQSSAKVWSGDDVRKKHSETLKKAYSSEDRRRMQADKNRKFRESKEGKKAFSERIKQYWASEKSQSDEEKKKRSEARKRSWITRKENNANN